MTSKTSRTSANIKMSTKTTALEPGYECRKCSSSLYSIHARGDPKMVMSSIQRPVSKIGSGLPKSADTGTKYHEAKERHHHQRERYLLKVVEGIQNRLAAKALRASRLNTDSVQTVDTVQNSRLPSISSRLQRLRILAMDEEVQEVYIQPVADVIPEAILEESPERKNSAKREVSAKGQNFVACGCSPERQGSLKRESSEKRQMSGKREGSAKSPALGKREGFTRTPRSPNRPVSHDESFWARERGRKPSLLRERSMSENSWCLQRLLNEMREEGLQDSPDVTPRISTVERKLQSWRRVTSGTARLEYPASKGSDVTPTESRGMNRWRQMRTIFFGDSQHNLLLTVVKKLRGRHCVNRKGRLLRRVHTTDNFHEPKSFRKVMPLVRFRRAVRSVMVLLKVNLASRQTSHRTGQTPMSWTDIEASMEASRRASELFGVTFDPSYYRAKREARISAEAKAILSIEPKHRTEEQLKAAMVGLKAAVEAFGEFPIKMQQSLVRVCWYEQYEAKRVIIRQGHVADYFYFILSGTAVVTILETSKQSGEQTANTVAFLKKGNSFGELALMHGARRSATVTCKDDMELLTVGREDFIDIFMPVVLDREPDHIAFLRSVDVLAGWPIDLLPPTDPKICLATYFRRGVLLCRDSNASEWIYVVMSGTCRVLKALVSTRPTIGRHDNRRDSCNNIEYQCSNWSTRVSRLAMSRGRDDVSSSQERKRQEKVPLPVIRTQDEDEVQRSEDEHKKQLEEIFRQRHVHINGDSESLNSSLGDELDKASRGSCNKRTKEMVFVQLQSLVPKDTFGLEQAVFSVMGQTTSTALVSEGAECVLISRKFFQQHLSEDIAKRIRRKMQPLPTEETLQQKLQTQTNWEAYKAMTISDLLIYRRLQDALHY